MADTSTIDAPAYPAHWEADVLLSDGRAARLRPIRPADKDLVLEFYTRVTHESKYMRYLAARETLTDRDLSRILDADFQRDVVFAVTMGRDIIAIGDFGRLGDEEAELAFLVQDTHHGRGLGTLLLEHLAQAGRELGVRRFVAEVLRENGKMVKAFRAAGYQLRSSLDEGLFRFEFDIHPTQTSLSVMASREHRAEASSMARIVGATHVAIVGASSRPNSIGHLLLRNLVLGGFTGRAYPVHPSANAICGLPAYPSVRDVPGPVDLAIIATPADAVPSVVEDCAAKGVHGLVVISTGYAELGPEGAARQRDLLDQVRRHGMRLIGPSCLGLLNTNPAYRLNASVSPVNPPAGRVGFFCQSGVLGTAILENVQRRGLGLSSFISAGNRADVSGNDLLQYWEEDEATEVILCYFESIGNPRKFSRIARRVGHTKPIVAVKSGRTHVGVPVGHAVRTSSAPPAAVDALFHQAGVIQVETLDEMFDVAQLLAHQPLPRGRRVGIVSNSPELGILATDAALRFGLKPTATRVLPVTTPASQYQEALTAVGQDDEVDAVVALYVTTPTLADAEVGAFAEALSEVGRESPKPIVSTFLAFHGVPQRLRVAGNGAAGRGSVPSYAGPDTAMKALAKVCQYARWVARPVTHVPVLTGIDEPAATALVHRVLQAHPEGAWLSDSDVTELMRRFGIRLEPYRRVATLEEAVGAAADLGWNVVLKATARHVGGRPFLAHVWRHIQHEQDMTAAWEGLLELVGDPVSARLVVQRMGTSGFPATITAGEDLLFGPVVSVGMTGPPSDLLHDVAYGIPPLTEGDAFDMVRSLGVAPLFFGYGENEPVDVAALEDLIHRVAQLKDALPELVRVEVALLIGPEGASVLRARAKIVHVETRSDWYTRRLSTPAPRDGA
ncbi:MAG: GNAT family N-acetyltransferase [Austwickia sp.]|nr:GNAT family N-acetyltransferase [Austwickia sp.]MBK8435344.1 GNAT family N-acetyltransferase [Austwickia sp.]MBK9101107.1 GNAT family N-acetyltransferase [Austwickia sp.]